MKKLLIISPHQFGYHTDFDKFYEYLFHKYETFYICHDDNHKKIPADHVFYIERIKHGLIDKLYFLYKITVYVLKMNPAIILLNYFYGCSVLAYIFAHKKIVVDIRTGFIDKDVEKCKKRNHIISTEANRFKHISVISEGLLERLNLSSKKAFVLPLGADCVVEKSKIIPFEKNKLYILYVGTFSLRNIEETIIGFGMFYQKHKEQIDCKYTLIGYSDSKSDIDAIHTAIKDNNLENVVHYIGRVPNNELKNYFETHYIGVSYVPLLDCFQHQPPTKTFEYIRNGLLCIATRTVENAKVINEYNGVLIEEGSIQFCNALDTLYENIEKYDRNYIIESSEQYSWDKIVMNILDKQLQQL